MFRLIFRMKVPGCVLWGLTKKFNAFLVKKKPHSFSEDPLNLTNLHNAASHGLANANSIGVQLDRVKAKKKFRRYEQQCSKFREFIVVRRHKSKKSGKDPLSSGPVSANTRIKKEVGKVSKAITNLRHASPRLVKLALVRLRRMHSANTVALKKVPGHKEKRPFNA